MHYSFLQPLNHQLMKQYKDHFKKGISFAHPYIYNKPAIGKVGYR